MSYIDHAQHYATILPALAAAHPDEKAAFGAPALTSAFTGWFTALIGGIPGYVASEVNELELSKDVVGALLGGRGFHGAIAAIIADAGNVFKDESFRSSAVYVLGLVLMVVPA